MEGEAPQSNFSKNIDSMIQEKEKNVKGAIPGDMQIFVVICYIASISLFLLGVGVLIYGLFGMNILGSMQGIFEQFRKYIIIMGIADLVFATLLFFMARAMKKAKPWVRIAAIILSSIGIILSVVFLIRRTDYVRSIGSLVINSLWLYYFGFNKKAKEYFSKKN